MVAVPGGASGSLVREARERSRPAGARIAPGVVSLVAELRGHERRAAEELRQWKTGVKERKVIDASPEIKLARLMTPVEFEALEKERRRWRNRGTRTFRWSRCR
jgi:hypothetical protein